MEQFDLKFNMCVYLVYLIRPDEKLPVINV